MVAIDVEHHLPSDLTIIGFIGCDGTGTTTHADYVVERFEEKGLTTRKEWMRFEHRLSLPVLGIARLLRMNDVYGNPDTHQVRVHRFEKSRLLTSAYKNTLLFDQQLLVLKKFRAIPEETDVLVCDRFILDALVNLVVSSKKSSLLESEYAEQYWELVPSESILIGLDCDAETLAARRSDVAQDPFLEFRTKAFRNLFEDKRINVVNTSQPLDSAREEIIEIIGEKYD